MAQRTTISAVQAVLNDDYGALESGSSPSLQPFIDTASAITDRVEACASRRNKALTAAELELVERWLAAHCYAMNDQPYSSRSVQGKSGSFQGQTGMYFEATKYGQTAISVDWSGCLMAIGKRQTARLSWVGKTIPEQSPYTDRME